MIKIVRLTSGTCGQVMTEYVDGAEVWFKDENGHIIKEIGQIDEVLEEYDEYNN